MVAEITGILVVLPRAMHTPLISIELWIPGAGVPKGSLGIGVPLSPSNPHPPPPPPGESHMKRAGMLVVLLRGVNFRLWSRLGCSGQNTIIFGRKGVF